MGFLADLFLGKPPYGKPKPQVGRWGEKYCRRILRKKGYRILDRNFKGRHGELDVVAVKKGVLVFVEVKTRKYDPAFTYGRPGDAVDLAKKKHLVYTAKEYVRRKKTTLPVRFDIFEVILHPDRAEWNHIEGAFRE